MISWRPARGLWLLLLIIILLFGLVFFGGLISTQPDFNIKLAGNKPLATVFESGHNDLILMQKGETPEEPSIADSKQDSRFDRQAKHRLVTICLQNAVAKSGAKAFDIHRNGLPRYVAQSGAKVCGKFEPTRHTIYFWKADKTGKMFLTLFNHLDLGDTDGTQVNLTWVRG